MMDSTAAAFNEEGLVEQTQGLPDWWRARGNRLMGPPDMDALPIIAHHGIPEPYDALVVVRAQPSALATLMISGRGARVFLGENIMLPGGFIHCGGASMIALEGGLGSGPNAWLDARNGGSVRVEREGLWSAGIRITTDDMHAIRDASSGERINKRGSSIEIKRHVWLGLDAMIQPGVTVGENCVVGARSIVTRDLPPGSLAVGVPARVVRENVTWSFDDAA